MTGSVFDRATCFDVLRAVGVELPSNDRRLARCPFHADETPSFRVFEKGFRCFGCGARGGLADLIVRLGFAYDRAGAATWLEGRLR